jgi:hypothetical protein
LLAPVVTDAQGLLAAIRRQEDGLRNLLQDVRRSLFRTRITADALRSIRATHPGERAVAFSQYTATIVGLWREMRFDPCVSGSSHPAPPEHANRNRSSELSSCLRLTFSAKA